MKKYLLFAGIGLTALAAYGRKQVQKVKAITDNIKVKLDRVNDFQLVGNAIELNINLKLINNTEYGFTVNSGEFIKLNKIELFTDAGQKIAEANKTISNISLQPGSATIIEDIDLVADANHLVPVVLNSLMQQPEKLVFKAHVNILGQNTII
jgi:cell fate (sporulation/competence/biofilm development) regulator YmcA (YheA/YmcA/DUF963 family)